MIDMVTPAVMTHAGAAGQALHQPIMVGEVLRVLAPRRGDIAIDCTLGGGGHARALLERVVPGGRVLGLDVDAFELAATAARFRADGFTQQDFSAHASSFARLQDILEAQGISGANVILADLGVSAMQHDTAARGFHYKKPGPLDMRMDASRGETAAALIARISEPELAAILESNADEPHAALIARLIKEQAVDTTHALERLVRTGIAAAYPGLSKPAVKMSVRRTFQALRIAVNNELAALDTLLDALPGCLAPGGRAAIITFHSGEDRRVKKAFQAGRRAGLFSAIADRAVRSTMEESRVNRRSRPAKLRWAVRG